MTSYFFCQSCQDLSRLLSGHHIFIEPRGRYINHLPNNTTQYLGSLPTYHIQLSDMNTRNSQSCRIVPIIWGENCCVCQDFIQCISSHYAVSILGIGSEEVGLSVIGKVGGGGDFVGKLRPVFFIGTSFVLTPHKFSIIAYRVLLLSSYLPPPPLDSRIDKRFNQLHSSPWNAGQNAWNPRQP